MRIASLLPAATEIVCALGARDALVGMSHECDYPHGVGELPALTSSRLAMPGSSAEIDRGVRNALQDALSLFAVDAERLAALAPDVILTQDLCAVCAVAYEDVQRAVDAVLPTPATIVSLNPYCLADLWTSIRAVAAAIEHVPQGESLIATLQQRLAAIRTHSSTAGPGPKVVTIEWLQPVMLGGLWTPELVRIAGGVPLGVEDGCKAPTVSRDALAALDPDVVVLKPCGYTVEQTLAERHVLPQAVPWELWRAVSNGRVYVVDGSAYFNRSGPRLVDSAEILAMLLDPVSNTAALSRYGTDVYQINAALQAESLHPQATRA